MIDYQFNLRKEFHDDVLAFCKENDMSIAHYPNQLTSVGGTPPNIQKLQLYIEELEVARTKYRRSKSYIWQLFHLYNR